MLTDVGSTGGRHLSSMLRAAGAATLAAVGAATLVAGQQPRPAPAAVVVLPPPATQGPLSLEEVLRRRRSVREYTTQALSDAEISQLTWAAQGITDPAGFRTAPSAGALYPLELYVATQTGLYHYEPRGHRLVQSAGEDLRAALSRAAFGQQAVAAAPAVFIVTAVPARTAAKYRAERAARYIELEAGHAAQNLLLQAVALGLGAVPVGAFDDAQIRRAVRVAPGEVVLYLIPVGHPR